MSVLSQRLFHCEEAAFGWLEATLWPHGPVCPHCGGMGRIGKIKANKEARVRLGLHKCGDCKRQFTVKIGTVFEQARIPLHKMLQAVHLMCSSKKGISAQQLHRILEIQYRSAWFLAHRIRPFGGAGGIVEVNEDSNGNDSGKKPHGEKESRGHAHKHEVLSLVDRATGQKRGMVADDFSAKTLVPIVEQNIAVAAPVITGEAGQYRKLATDLAGHGFTRHSQGEYVDVIDCTIHPNTTKVRSPCSSVG